MNKKMTTRMRNEEEPLPDGDLEDQEIELHPAHRAEALAPSSSSSPCYENGCTSRKWIFYLGKSQWCKPVGFLFFFHPSDFM